MNKRHYEHTLPNIRGSLSNTYDKLSFLTSTRPFLPFSSLRILSRQAFSVPHRIGFTGANMGCRA